MFKKITIVFFLASAQLAFAQKTALAQDDSLKTYKLSDVVITATRITTPETEIASSVTIIDEKQIQNSNKNSLVDLLRDVPGLSVTRQGGPGTNASVFIRGGNPNHTLVMIDGVSVNDPSSVSNSYDFTNLQTDNIERIEILRGPQSTLYGSDALAGVISIFTKKGNGSPKVNLLTEAGSYDSYRVNAALNGSNSFINYSFSYSGLNIGGFSAANEIYGNTEKDGFNNFSVRSRLGLKITDYLNLDLNFNYLRSNADLDQNFMKGDDPNYYSDLDESVCRTAGNMILFGGTWQQTFAFSSLRHINHTIDDSDAVNKYNSIADFDGSKYKLEWQNNIFINEYATVIFGIERTREKAATYYKSDGQYGAFESRFPNEQTSDPLATTTGVFIQEQLSFDGIYSGTVGLRYDKHNKFGSEITWRIAPAFMLKESQTKLKATYGTAFKSPSLFYLLDPVFGNPDLKPEKSRGWDVGIEQYLLNSRIVFGMSYFNNSFTDLLGYDENYKTINIDKAKTKGIELFLTTLPIYNISFNINYTYSDCKDRSENKTESGMDLIRRPKNKISFAVNYSLDNANINMSILNMGKRSDKDFTGLNGPNRIELAAYTLVNLAAAFDINKYLTIFGRIDNLFDAEYEDVLYYGTPQRSFYAGLKLSY